MNPFRQLETGENRDIRRRPILLVVDDFERGLEAVPGAIHRVQPELTPTIAALIAAFATKGHDSLLLFTSRFRFTCDLGGNDAAKCLTFIQLPDMPEGELCRQSLNLARQKVADEFKHSRFVNPDEIVRRERQVFGELSEAADLAFGSPSLLNRAARLLAESAEGFARFKHAARQYAVTGVADEQDLRNFLERVAIGELLGLLTPDEQEFLRRGTLFRIPVPISVLALLVSPQGERTASGSAIVNRLFALGLLNRFENPVDFRGGHDHGLIDPLVRPALERGGSSNESDPDGSEFASLVCKRLFAAWGGAGKAAERPLPLKRELTRLGLKASDAEVLAADAPDVVGALYARNAYTEAAELGRKCITVISGADAALPFQLLRHTAVSCSMIGEVDFHAPVEEWP